MFSGKVFKSINRFPNYFVNSEGEVYSIRSKRILRPLLSSMGYYQVSVCAEGTILKQFIHRLVMEAFYGASKLVVNHIDSNPRNNRIENLEYCTQRENVLHGYRHGKNPTLFTDEQILEVRRRYINEKVKDLAKEFGVQTSAICKIAKGQLYKHLPTPKENLISRKGQGQCRKL